MRTEPLPDEASLEDYIIRKGTIDNDLWNRILGLSKDGDSDRISAGKLIIENYRTLPSEADAILKELAAPAQNSDVRKGIASLLVAERVEIPAGLYFDLLRILAEDPDQEVRDIVTPKIRTVMEPWLRLAQLWEEYQANMVSRFAELIANYHQALSSSLSQFRKFVVEISSILNEPEFRNFEYNWLVFLPFDTMLKLYEMYKVGKSAEVKKLLIDACKDKKYLEEFIEKMKTSSLLSPRISIIQDAIAAHEDGRYSLSVPVLLTQVEGVLWDYAEKQGIAAGTRITTKTGKKFNAKSARPLVEDTTVRDSMSDDLANYFLDKVYTKDFRHGILHGRKIDYSNEENSTNLLLLMRAIMDTCD